MTVIIVRNWWKKVSDSDSISIKKRLSVDQFFIIWCSISGNGVNGIFQDYCHLYDPFGIKKFIFRLMDTWILTLSYNKLLKKKRWKSVDPSRKNCSDALIKRMQLIQRGYIKCKVQMSDIQVVSLDPTWFDGFTVEGSGTPDIIQVVCYGNAWCGHNSHYVSTSRISRKKDGSSLDNYVLALPHVVISTIHVWKNFRRCLTTHSTTGPFYHRTVWGVLSMHYIHGKEPHKHWWTVEHAHRATKILSLNIS